MASIIKVNNVQNTAAGKNIIKEVGNTVTIGASGDTVALAAGASQSGFGQTYSAVSWDTTAKTTTVTGVAGVGYFINTSGGAVTANLPAGVAGDVIAFADYTRTFQTNNLTITPNGSEKVGGVAANFVAQTEGQSITLVYVDATEGWINTAESTGQAGLLPAFVTATGGTITCSGDYKIHTFTGPGTFTVCSVGNRLGSETVDYMVIAGGGGGGPSSSSNGGGGGGAGGYRESSGSASGSYTIGLPSQNCAVSALAVSAQGYSIIVGGGGSINTNGVNSVFSTITSTGGGAGGSGPGDAGNSGGSGGGPGKANPLSGGAGNTPPVSPSQGNNGGNNPGSPNESSPQVGTGGGGAGSAAAGVVSNTRGGAGAVGATSSITASPVKRAGGGGGGGADPGGGGGIFPLCVSGAPSLLCRTAQYGSGSGGITAGGQGGSGTANTGGGAGGGGNNGDDGGTGGSGVVIIRYKFQ